jgi:hypothetical protein
MLASLGPKPTMLYHLHKEGSKYVIKCSIPVTQDYKPLVIPAPYSKLDIEATKAIASLVSDANNNNPDLTKHPWALHSVWRLATLLGIAVILEWQPATTMTRTTTAGDVTPVESGSTTLFTPLRLLSVAGADETASILYVIPYVHYTRG